MTAESAAKRPRENRRRRRPLQRGIVLGVKILLCLVCGAGLGLAARFGYQWMRHSPWFALRTVAVRTGPRVSAEVVKQLSGIQEGKNIFSVSLEEAVQKIEFHPWVRRAEVSRRLPDRVEITVWERKPLAVAALESLYYVDQEGEVFKRVVPGEPLDFPVITGLSLNEVISDPPSTAARLLKVKTVLDLARGSRVLPAAEISEIQLDSDGGLTLVTLQEGMRIRMGGEEFSERWARLERVLVELAGDWDKVASVDLDFQGHAAVKLRSGYQVAKK